jgi:hypothetical protein
MLWHLGRFADGFQAEIAGAQRSHCSLGDAREVCFTEDLAVRWGLDPATLSVTYSKPCFRKSSWSFTRQLVQVRADKR